ncbi:MAG: hypothetical protein ACLFSQ_04655 [Candidatus Zixiibacteriota bacterium]
MTIFLIILNLILLLSIAGYIIYHRYRKEYIIALGNFQTRLNNLTDFTDFLALNYGSQNQQAIYLKSKLYAKSIKSLSGYWYYIDSLTSTADIFIISSEDDGMKHRRRFLAYITQAKTALITLQEKSEKIKKLMPWFEKMIVRIKYDLGENSSIDSRKKFIGKAVSNLTLHRKF